MANLTGSWKLNEYVDCSDLLPNDVSASSVSAKFCCNGINYTMLGATNYTLSYIDANSNIEVFVGQGSSKKSIYVEPEYRIINIEPTNEYDSFGWWLQKNATQIIIGEDDKTYTVKGQTLQSIADAIRSKTDKTDLIAVEDFDNSIAEVYDAGKAKGHGEGYNDGVADGKQAEYDAFWDAYMPDDLTNWQYVFYSPRWNDANFYPKRDIKPVGAASFSFSSHQISNFKQRLIDCNVVFDTSKVTGGNYMFAFCGNLTHLPTISFVGLTESISHVFDNNRNLVEIEKIILKEDGSTTFSCWFDNCTALTTIAFEGVIGNDIDFQWSTGLTRASIESILSHMPDMYSDLTGKTLTLSTTAVDREFEGVSPADFITIVQGRDSLDWFNVLMQWDNWTIILG